MIFNYKKENLLSVNGHIFKPGVSDYPQVTDAVYKDLLDNYPKFKSLVESGDLESQSGNLSSSSSDSSGEGSSSLSNMRERDAISLVKQTTDQQLLQNWLNQKQSSSVERAIKEQIKTLEKMS